jgi:SAM-dependent methyltransferase
MTTSHLAILERHKRDWEELADLDPLWAVLTEPEARFGNWDLTEFFQTGDKEIDQIMGVAEALGKPLEKRRALDFGCGVGRLTRALAHFFDRVDGVDISQGMISKAADLNKSFSTCHFHLNSRFDLRLFDDAEFDLVCSKIVLQHLPDKKLIESYLQEFVRVLRPGGLLVFQLPSYIPLRNRIQVRRKIYGLLKRLGIREALLYKTLGLNPMRMNFLGKVRVENVLQRAGSSLLADIPNTDAGPEIASFTYYATK